MEYEVSWVIVSQSVMVFMILAAVLCIAVVLLLDVLRDYRRKEQ